MSRPKAWSRSCRTRRRARDWPGFPRRNPRSWHRGRCGARPRTPRRSRRARQPAGMGVSFALETIIPGQPQGRDAMTMLKTAVKLAAAMVALCAGFQAAAQTYPTRPVKIIVPATTGGAIDVIARVLADKMTASLGQPVVVENKPGASNNLGTD